MEEKDPEDMIDQKMLERVKCVHRLSSKYNKLTKKKHSKKLLELMKDHVEEIKELEEWGDNHALVETGDLIILCFELLIEHDVPINDMIDKCVGRYEKKLTALIEETEK